LERGRHNIQQIGGVCIARFWQKIGFKDKLANNIYKYAILGLFIARLVLVANCKIWVHFLAFMLIFISIDLSLFSTARLHDGDRGQCGEETLVVLPTGLASEGKFNSIG